MHCKHTKSKNSYNYKVLLIGPPNVGKSAFFNQLTGMNVNVANYTGTTVEYTEGKMVIEGTEFLLVDVPGTYTLDATNEAEKVAVDMLGEKPAAVICVVDANNLESSIYLLLQLLEQELPVVVALNRSDIAREKGYDIDSDFLSRELGVTIISTVAVTGKGMDKLKNTVMETMDKDRIPSPSWEAEKKARWLKAEELVVRAQKLQQRPLLRRQKWGEWLVQPWPGLLLAFVILIIVLASVIGIGMGLRQAILLPLFRNLIIPQIVLLVESIISPGLLQNIFIGEYGFLVKGLEWPFTLVMPYVISFYTVLSVLEDSGYLPRLGVLLDGLLNKIGLQGSSIVPLLLGLGCGIPGVLATRSLNSSKERLIVSSIICLTVPCISQTGAFISLLAERSLWVFLAVFLVSGVALVTAGFLMDRMLKGPHKQTLMEIPDLLVPRKNIIFKKVWIRLRGFIMDGAVPMMVAVALAALLYETGLMAAWGRLLRPLVVGWLGLPEEAAVPLVLGILRREMAVLPLMEMELTMLQLFVGAVVGLFYVPCVAMIAVLAREFKLFTAFAVLFFTTFFSFLIGGIFFHLGTFILY